MPTQREVNAAAAAHAVQAPPPGPPPPMGSIACEANCFTPTLPECSVAVIGSSEA